VEVTEEGPRLKPSRDGFRGSYVTSLGLEGFQRERCGKAR
jgi:hypothetical protein